MSYYFATDAAQPGAARRQSTFPLHFSKPDSPGAGSEVEPEARFETHLHEGEQITTVVEGELFFEVGREIVRVGVGEAIAIPPHVSHAVFAGPSGARAFDAWSPPEHLFREATPAPAAASRYDTVEVPYEA